MATKLTQAWYLDILNKLVLKFDGTIDISAGVDYSKIQLSPDGGTTEPTITSASIYSNGDSKYVWITLNSGAASTITGWSDSQKQTIEMELLSGALTDINLIATDAIAYSDDIRCQYIYEDSLAATWDCFDPTVDEYLCLPPATTIVSDDLVHNLAKSIIIWKIKGTDETSVLSGGLAFANRGEATTANPIIMEVENCFINGNIDIQPGNISNPYKTSWIEIQPTEYLAVKFTTDAAINPSHIAISKAYCGWYNSSSSIYAELRADNAGVPASTVLATTGSMVVSGTPAGASGALTTAITLTATTDYWVIVKVGGAKSVNILGSLVTPVSSKSTSTDGTSWTGATAGGFSFSLQTSTVGLPLSLKITNCNFLGSILENGSTARWAGSKLNDSSLTSIWNRCTVVFQTSISEDAYSEWSFINSIISPELEELIDDEKLTLTYCNYSLAFKSGKAYNCYKNDTTADTIIPDNVNDSGLTDVALSDTQGYGWTNGSSLNMGKSLTITPLGTDSPSERASGIPKGLTCAVGSFNSKPAQTLTITNASVSGNTVILSYSETVNSGDVIRGIVNNVESTTGQIIAQNTQFTEEV